jgi:dihydroorotase
MKLCISNGRVINPATHYDQIASVYIQNGKVISIGEQPESFMPDRTIDASNLIVCPGFVDLSARFREPGQEHTATIDSESRAAAKGGITSVCIPPDTDPVIDTPAVVELIEDRAKKAGRTMVYTIGALTQQLEGDLLSEMMSLKDAGCIGVSNGNRSIKNSLILSRALEYAATLNLTVFINASDPWFQNIGCMHEGPVSTRLGLSGIPEAAETIAISRHLILIEKTGATAHFHSLSSSESVNLIRSAQEKGLRVTADVSPHHLHLTDESIGNYDSACHVLPPLRSELDKERLQEALRDGVITAISSHHQPLDNDEKLGPFAETTPGISGLETLFLLTMKLVDDGKINLTEAIASLTINPARILGVTAGDISEGNRADICIFNPNSSHTFNNNAIISAGKNSPFDGWTFNHQIYCTLFHGKVVYQLNA